MRWGEYVRRSAVYGGVSMWRSGPCPGGLLLGALWGYRTNLRCGVSRWGSGRWGSRTSLRCGGSRWGSGRWGSRTKLRCGGGLTLCWRGRAVRRGHSQWSLQGAVPLLPLLLHPPTAGLAAAGVAHLAAAASCAGQAQLGAQPRPGFQRHGRGPRPDAAPSLHSCAVQPPRRSPSTPPSPQVCAGRPLLPPSCGRAGAQGYAGGRQAPRCDPA